MRAVALVTDLMDRSKIGAAVEGIVFASTPVECAGADLVVIDLGTFNREVAEVRAVAAEARIVAFGRHNDPDALARAREDGANEALPRSRFFRDPVEAVTP